MNANELFPPSEYLKSEDIDNAGGELELKVSSVGRKEYSNENGKKDVKGVVEFSGTDKKLVINSTNTHTLIAMFGEETDDWINKKIRLYVDEHVQFQGKETRGIRIRLIDEKQDRVTQFWSKARELGYTREEGQTLLKKHNNNFEEAMKELG